MSEKVFGVILAGGRGRRLGGVDKAGLAIGQRTALTRAKAAMEDLDAVAVSGRDGEGLPRLSDPQPDKGPLAGLAAGLAWAQENDAAWLVTAPVDAPFLSAAVYQRLVAAASGSEIVTAVAGGRTHWLVAAWSTALAPAALQALANDDLSIARFAKAHRRRALAFPGGADMFLNINTESDLARARAKAGGDADHG